MKKIILVLVMICAGLIQLSAQNCLPPTNVAGSNISMTSVDLSWTDANTPSSTSFEMEVSIGNVPPAGPPLIFGIMNNPYSLSNLQSNTEYCVYIRSVCGSNRSAYTSNAFCFNTLDAPTSVKSNKSDKELLSIYPNPSTGAINIKTSLFGHKVTVIKLINLDGKVLRSINKAELSGSSFTLDIAQKGFYLCKIGLDNGTVLHEKVLVQ